MERSAGWITERGLRTVSAKEWERIAKITSGSADLKKTKNIRIRRSDYATATFAIARDAGVKILHFDDRGVNGMVYTIRKADTNKATAALEKAGVKFKEEGK